MTRTCPSCGATNRIPAGHLADAGKCGRCKTVLTAAAAPIEVADAATFDAIVAGAKVPVLVDFWASWCGPCRQVAPEVAKTAAALSGRALVVKVSTEEVPALAARYDVRSIPNFAVFVGGKLVTQRAGAMRASELQRLVDR